VLGTDTETSETRDETLDDGTGENNNSNRGGKENG
jgi:hypothetical protein